MDAAVASTASRGSKDLRILHIGTGLGYGGVQVLMATLIREQQKMGLDAEAFFFTDRGGFDYFRSLCPIHIGSESSLDDVISKGRFDIIHTVTYVAEELSASIRRTGFRGAVVVTTHQFGEYERSLAADCVTAVSAAVAASIQDRYASEVRVVRNGVDTSRFHPMESGLAGKPIIGWVGRCADPIKDFDGFLAFANAMSGSFAFEVVDGSATDFEVAGWLPPETAVRRKLPWDEMPKVYRRLRASQGFLLSTSRSEAAGLNLIEAQACGCPVIAPAIDGIPEYVARGASGFLYDRDDGLEGIRAAVDLLYAPGRYEEVSRAAAEYAARKHPAEKMCAEYLGIYEEALQRRGKHATLAPRGSRH